MTLRVLHFWLWNFPSQYEQDSNPQTLRGGCATRPAATSKISWAARQSGGKPAMPSRTGGSAD
jgi:hypothetical protein